MIIGNKLLEVELWLFFDYKEIKNFESGWVIFFIIWFRLYSDWDFFKNIGLYLSI